MPVLAPSPPSATAPAAADRGVLLWERHFRDPLAAQESARAMLAEPGSDERTRGWAEITLAFNHLSVSAMPVEAEAGLARAREIFERCGDRRGQLLAEIGSSRLLIVQQAPVPARERLLAIRDEAAVLLPAEDRFWLLNALGATFFYADQVDEAIRYIYQALETLRSVDLSPQLPTVRSNASPPPFSV